MSLVSRLLPLVAVLALPAAAAAQSPSPTLPSDTLEANFAPRSAPGPSPELAPSLPSDTLDTGVPAVVPDSASGEMRRDWDQEDSDDLWKEEEQAEALRIRLG
ncbi:MAG TPA: hypothetical protein VFT84_03640 [Gemmatimonadales bacterium]|nr:hypothetical protein [Gemmatimonadales bacterium]